MYNNNYETLNVIPGCENVESIISEIEKNLSPTVGMVSNCPKLNVRKNPDTSADIITTIVRGIDVEIIDRSNDKFYQIKLPDGRSGYCMKEYIKIK